MGVQISVMIATKAGLKPQSLGVGVDYQLFIDSIGDRAAAYERSISLEQCRTLSNTWIGNGPCLTLHLDAITPRRCRPMSLARRVATLNQATPLAVPMITE